MAQRLEAGRRRAGCSRDRAAHPAGSAAVPAGQERRGAARRSPGTGGRARPAAAGAPCPALAPVPPVTPPPRNGDHRAQEQPPSPRDRLPAPGTDLRGAPRPRRGPAGRGPLALGHGPGTAPAPPAARTDPRRLQLRLVPGYSPRHCHGGASSRARRLPLGKLISLPLLPFANLPKEPAKSQKRLGNERRRLKS